MSNLKYAVQHERRNVILLIQCDEYVSAVNRGDAAGTIDWHHRDRDQCRDIKQNSGWNTD